MAVRRVVLLAVLKVVDLDDYLEQRLVALWVALKALL